MFDSIDRFGKYMGKPNFVYFIIGVSLFMFGTFIAPNPIMEMHFHSPFDVTIININSTPIVSLLFNPWFYWIMGFLYSGTSVIYWLLNGWIE
jgi:hypothetical protein